MNRLRNCCVAVSILMAFVLIAFSVTAVAAKKVTLEVWGLDPEDQGYGAMIRAWNEAHPDIQVQSIAAGIRIQDPQKLMTAIAAGTPPDVAWVDRFQIASWVSRGAFQALDQYVKESNLDLREIYYGPAVDEATYQGHVWAIPTTVDSRALFINLDLFAEAGIDPNSLDTGNWEQLKEYAVKLTKRSAGKIEQIGFVPTQDPWSLGSGGMWLWGWANGGRELSEDGKKVTLNNPKFVEALEWAVDVIDASGGMVAVSDFASGFGSGAQEGFLQGKIAIRLNNSAFLREIARYVPDLNFDVIPIKMRNSDEYMSFGGGHSLVIPRGARHPKEAWEFIKWFTSVDGWKIYAQGWKDFFAKEGRPWIPTFTANKPANRVIIDEMFEPTDEKWRKYVNIFEDLLNVAMFRAQSPVAQIIHTTFLFEAQQEAQYHRKSAQHALDEATAKCQKELDMYLKHQ